MMRDQLRLVLQPDDQLVKITTVIAIDDHSGVERMRHVILSRFLWETAWRSGLAWRALGEPPGCPRSLR